MTYGSIMHLQALQQIISKDGLDFSVILRLLPIIA